MSAPLVSVLVTTYKHARYVEEALESLRAQTSRDFEVIITDDASPDGTGEVIERWLARTGFPARFLRNAENRGICKNRNAALALASGRFVCSLSGDDVYEPERIERQLACFLQQPEVVAAVYSDATVIDAAGREVSPSYLASELGSEPPPEGRDVFQRLLRACFICAPATMVRKGAVEAVRGYDEALAFEDYDMWLRLSHRYDFVHLPGRLMRYRVLPDSLSHDPARKRASLLSHERIFDKWLAADLDRNERKLVLDAIWRVGKDHLYRSDDVEARAVFAKAARADDRIDRFVIARLLRLPVACDAARVAARVYRRLRDRLASV